MTELICAILLPLIPAYILYKGLRSTATISGPFQGFKLHLSGAFAGYFILVVAVFHYSPLFHPDNYQVWEVKGHLNLDPLTSQSSSVKPRIAVEPPFQNVFDDGRFDMEIVTIPGEKGQIKFPTLIFQHPDYQSVSIDLNDEGKSYGEQPVKFTRDRKNQAIILQDAVHLVKRPLTYTGAGPAPQAVAGGNR